MTDAVQDGQWNRVENLHMDTVMLEFSTPEDARPGEQPTQASRRCDTGIMFTDATDCRACGATGLQACRDPDAGVL